MNSNGEKKETLYPHVSVDCVLLGIDNEQLNVLLVERKDAGTGKTEFKLPGSLIYESEDLDEAAHRVLSETSGLKRVPLKQFQAFGSPLRTANKKDVEWLEKSSNMKIDRIVTIAYLALCKVRKTKPDAKFGVVQWIPVNQLPELPFDHLEIIRAAIREIRVWTEIEPAIIFSHLPSLFTALQLRKTYEVIYDKELDVRNFHKKMNSLSYIVQTDETEQGVAHRSARYYRFDKVKYNKLRSKLNKT
ncbi:8-oxo-dGTP diphosphatase [Parabacteroides sp. PF5-5]|uniref:NUDIX hydrolase n=1 Tax=unclassified Parabacteroides TaxID=2649774 RepID=UPI002472F863|nr:MULTISPECIES: NUDIX domain-containing protein [unclassified Parabacteroides]MDH6304155.1 8-oxo-dGTP diphosphatase [Parabacteroides sp. PH5-39]MDH6315129.1 8-oxo-dGTP diphosphatase [Parabacteroides sp. PF5-13]MDH6318790.1 8-oxo-dGTP diphosphatase [Parabacteroides sp. PH5-13]MDH6322519.1 8-oxo-dGTP diphosphatase [Parabacteroides sp. PH5-8]MDH6326345.1 8-oxo-dGTP diphosphatase [Parabacteroides sp. PH5-41]